MAAAVGGIDYDYAYCIHLDDLNCVYIGGLFRETVDFGDGNPVVSNGSSDSFLLKLGNTCSFEWVKTWGSVETDYCYSTCTDSNNNIFVAGAFKDTVDFDIGYPVTSHGMSDCYLLNW